MAERPHFHGNEVSLRGCRCFGSRGGDSFLSSGVLSPPVGQVHTHVCTQSFIFSRLCYRHYFSWVDLETNLCSAPLFLRPKALGSHRSRASKCILAGQDSQRLLFYWHFLVLVEYIHKHTVRQTQCQPFFMELFLDASLNWSVHACWMKWQFFLPGLQLIINKSQHIGLGIQTRL